MHPNFYIVVIIISLISCNQKHPSKQTVKKEDSNQFSQAVADQNLSGNKGFSGEMILFQGGSFIMGSPKGTTLDKPAHKVDIRSFYIDSSPVTVGQFQQFIEATGFKTDAENFGDAGVFDYNNASWSLVQGAFWKYPLGKNKPQSESNHPVTQVSWNDAIAYSKWLGKRLPTEAEWEYAARCGGKNDGMFSWGNQLIVNGKFMANVWQGDISTKQGEDGYLTTSPVGFYGKNSCGMTDMGGNVWNWCADEFKLYPGNNEVIPLNSNLRVIRGGSFLFDTNGENSFSVWGRAYNTYETSLFNTGFRCAKDAN